MVSCAYWYSYYHYSLGGFIRYTQKQIDKFNRQKQLTLLDKISKNLFRMFRNENTTAKSFVEKFGTLKKRVDLQEEMQLDSEYHQQLKAYILRLHEQTCQKEDFTDVEFKNICAAEMSNLNRLQKLKNDNSYKKDKHKSKRQNEDWG